MKVLDYATEDGRLRFEAMLAQLRQSTTVRSDAAATVAAILADVREQGDEAVVRYMRQWTDPGFSSQRIVVTPGEIDAAVGQADSKVMAAIERSIAHVREYQRHILPAPVKPITLGGAELGLRYTPVDSVGLCVPGGTAVLFSTLIMLAVPALVAGVDPGRISVIHPPPTRRADEPARDISPIVLATCRLLGIDRVYRIGGAQGVAALAFGTNTVRKVDLIAGPGNVFVQLAKAQVSGYCGTDNGFYGPSEICTIADDSADPRRVAADLLAQSEHDPGRCFLVTWDRGVIDRIVAEVSLQLSKRQRREAVEQSLRDWSAAVLVRGVDEAAEVADAIACEHVNLAVADPDALLAKLRHGGEFFLGDATPVAAGDYYAGPSHCLPTGTTARFSSGVSVHTFLKRSGTVAYRRGMPSQVIADVVTLATAEGLDAHAHSARVRG